MQNEYPCMWKKKRYLLHECCKSLLKKNSVGELCKTFRNGYGLDQLCEQLGTGKFPRKNNS